MKELFNVGIDLGNSQVKAVSDNNKIVFNSLYTDGIDDLSTVECIKVKYNNYKYQIGIGSPNLNVAKYENQAFKIMLLTAISKLAPKKKVINANITIGLPVDLFKDNTFKENLINHILGFKSEIIEVDGMEKTISVDYCSVWVESGISLAEFEDHKNKNFTIVDIGGYTLDVIEFLQLKLGGNGTKRIGLIPLKESVAKRFQEDNNIRILSDGNIERLFSNVIGKKDIIIGDKTYELSKYSQMIDEYISQIFDYLEINFNINDKHIIFMGGGSLALKNYLKKYEKHFTMTILPNADFINAITFYKQSLREFEKMQQDEETTA